MVYSREKLLDDGHWTSINYRQRITRAQWREMLLNYDDNIIYHGRVYRFKAKNLGAGVYEIYKVELNA